MEIDCTTVLWRNTLLDYWRSQIWERSMIFKHVDASYERSQSYDTSKRCPCSARIHNFPSTVRNHRSELRHDTGKKWKHVKKTWTFLEGKLGFSRFWAIPAFPPSKNKHVFCSCCSCVFSFSGFLRVFFNEKHLKKKRKQMEKNMFKKLQSLEENYVFPNFG